MSVRCPKCKVRLNSSASLPGHLRRRHKTERGGAGSLSQAFAVPQGGYRLAPSPEPASGVHSTFGAGTRPESSRAASSAPKKKLVAEIPGDPVPRAWLSGERREYRILSWAALSETERAKHREPAPAASVAPAAPKSKPLNWVPWALGAGVVLFLLSGISVEPGSVADARLISKYQPER